VRVKVHFRCNPATGEVEVFEIDDEASTLPEDEHNREHDRIAAEIGNVIERNPRIVEVLPEGGAAPAQTPSEQPQPEQTDEARTPPAAKRATDH
jgi:hypothetical protein